MLVQIAFPVAGIAAIRFGENYRRNPGIYGVVVHVVVILVFGYCLLNWGALTTVTV